MSTRNWLAMASSKAMPETSLEILWVELGRPLPLTKRLGRRWGQTLIKGFCGHYLVSLFASAPLLMNHDSAAPD